MALSQAVASGDDEDAAPESLTLSESKKNAERLDEALQAAKLDAKRRRKERNRRKDENLKKRAKETRGERTKRKQGKTEGVTTLDSKGDETRKLESRMQRAMQEANEEDEDEDDESWQGFGDGEDVGLDAGSYQESNSSAGSSVGLAPSSDESMEGVEENEARSDSELAHDPKRDYLPEHLFSEVLSKATTRIERDSGIPSGKRQVKSKFDQKRKPPKKRSAKDIIVGSKTIRSISPKTSHLSSSASRTLPPGKVKRFYESHLNLRSNHASGKHRNLWNRKAANIGVLRSSTLPAAHFARSS